MSGWERGPSSGQDLGSQTNKKRFLFIWAESDNDRVTGL